MPSIALTPIRSKQDFEYLYNRYYKTLVYLAKGFVESQSIAEELVQDAYLKLWERRHLLHEGSNLINYLYTLTKNAAINYLHHKELSERTMREHLIPELQFKQQALNELPDSFSEFNELIARIDTIIDSLPDDVRSIFIKSRFDGKTYPEIAKELQISIKTVEAKISKALKVFRVELADYHPTAIIFVLIYFRF